MVIGFPSNDFGEQEPGSDKGNRRFLPPDLRCRVPDGGKTVVKGKGANPFYRQLAEITGSTPKWNFHKYLINRDGTQVVAYTSFTKPEDKDLLKKIDEFLNKPQPQESAMNAPEKFSCLMSRPPPIPAAWPSRMWACAACATRCN